MAGALTVQAQTVIVPESQLTSSSNFSGVSTDGGVFRASTSTIASVHSLVVIDSGSVYLGLNASRGNVIDTGRRSDLQTFELRGDGTVQLADNAPVPASVYTKVGAPITVGTQYKAIGSAFTLSGLEYVPFLDATARRVELFTFDGTAFTNTGLFVALTGPTGTPDGLGNYFVGSVALANLRVAVGDAHLVKFFEFQTGIHYASVAVTQSDLVTPNTNPALDVDFWPPVDPTSLYHSLANSAFRTNMALVPPLPTVQIASAAPGTITLTFTGTLEQSDDLVTWTPVTPAPVSPWTTPAHAPRRFYRAKTP